MHKRSKRLDVTFEEPFHMRLRRIVFFFGDQFHYPIHGEKARFASVSSVVHAGEVSWQGTWMSAGGYCGSCPQIQATTASTLQVTVQ
jgi:hypothetical protein